MLAFLYPEKLEQLYQFSAAGPSLNYSKKTL